MRVPQEIVDAIIDSFAMSDDEKISLISSRPGWREPDAANSLRACSLTSRSFLLRSRMHLFSAIFCQYHWDVLDLDRLLAESPHIGELYVRYFTLNISANIIPFLAEDIVLPRILSRLPSLTHFTLVFPIYGFPSIYGVWPSLFKASIRATLSLHCLRSLCLRWTHFADASELELLLGHATGLKALILGDIYFENSSVRRVDPPEVRIVLESFELQRVKMDVVDAMVSSFSTVDIKHLKSLVAHASPSILLLKANAQTIQRVRASFSRCPFQFSLFLQTVDRN
jgi:hypothetical protein